jgi:hypothetical protein
VVRPGEAAEPAIKAKRTRPNRCGVVEQAARTMPCPRLCPKWEVFGCTQCPFGTVLQRYWSTVKMTARFA